jgi:predicted branched-subunit amino acid permease
MGGQGHSDLRTGVRAGLPFALATFVLGISFGVLAQPLMGSLAPVVMSIVVFAGAAQFGALAGWASAAAPEPPSPPACCSMPDISPWASDWLRRCEVL